MLLNDHATNIASKGVLASNAVGVTSKGYIVTLEYERIACDYPHAIKIATAGFLGSPVGTSSRGYIPRVCIPPEDTEPTRRTTGPAIRGFREELKPRDRVVKITVHAYGKKWETRQTIKNNVRLKIKDVDIVDDGERIVDIKVSNISTLKNDKN